MSAPTAPGPVALPYRRSAEIIALRRWPLKLHDIGKRSVIAGNRLWHWATLVLWIFVIVYWLAAGRDTKADGRTPNDGRRLIGISITLALFLLLYWPVFRFGALGWPIFPGTEAIQIVGLLLCLAGLFFASWARYTLGRNWSDLPMVKRDHELIVTGPYAVVRHPIYAGFSLAAVGCMLTLGEARGALVAAAVFGFAWERCVKEEGVMLESFPGSYPSYAKRVRALIPFLL
jgi:protein-S-isoprenylcysteine O-methyltransferase Ste14